MSQLRRRALRDVLRQSSSIRLHWRRAQRDARGRLAGFYETTRGSPAKPLEAIGEKYFSQGSVSDPMSVAYMEVTNGHDHLLLRQTRKSIYEPLSFELTPGRLIDQGVTVCIHDSEIKKEMRYHFNWSAEPFEDQKSICSLRYSGTWSRV